jgi:hypothetical protein
LYLGDLNNFDNQIILELPVRIEEYKSENINPLIDVKTIRSNITTKMDNPVENIVSNGNISNDVGTIK